MIYLLLISLKAHSIDLYLGNKKFIFNENKNKLIVYDYCLKNESCMANNLKNYFHNKKTRDGGKNPASQFCGEANIVILTDTQKNQHSVCLFKDNSMVTTDSVFAYLKSIKNN